MKRFFFHLCTRDDYSPDEDGSLFPDLDIAYLNACQAALELSAEAIRGRKSAVGWRFDICGEDGALLIELPFSELLTGPPTSARMADPLLLDRISSEIERGRRLRAELAAGFEQARRTLETTQALLRADAARAA